MNIYEAAKAIIPLIEKSAPLLASLIGKPVSSVIETVFSLIADAYEEDPKNTSGIVDAVINDPNKDQVFKNIENDNKSWLVDMVNQMIPSSFEMNIKAEWDNDK